VARRAEIYRIQSASFRTSGKETVTWFARKTLESFDFSFQPNVVFLGPLGTGKTHLAIAVGLKAIQQGYRTLFTAALLLIATLTKAYAEDRPEEHLKQDCVPKLLIIDGISCIPIDRHGTHLFFKLISRRYERGAIILTSNQGSALHVMLAQKFRALPEFP
jgi:DNA replication protein DnaC